MSATRTELVNLNANGLRLKPIPHIHCANGGVGGGRPRRRNCKAIFLFSVIVAQTICMVLGFIGFAYIVDLKITKFNSEMRNTSQELHAYRVLMAEKIAYLNTEIEALKRNNTTKATPRAMPPLHGTKTEIIKAVTVETVDEFPEIENVKEDLLEDEFESSEEYEDPSQIPSSVAINNNASNSWAPRSIFSSDISPPLDKEIPRKPNFQQRVSEKQQQLAANSSTRNMPPALSAVPFRSSFSQQLESVNLGHDQPNDEDSVVPVNNMKPIRKPTPTLADKEMLEKNSNKAYKQVNGKSVTRARRKRDAKPVQDASQPLMNSISPTPLSLSVDRRKEANRAADNVWSWPAAHFDSHDLSAQMNSNRRPGADDCPKEIQNNPRKWMAPKLSGSEHFDLNSYENITVKKEGLYFVYSQIYFYRDRSIFGYLIKKKEQSVLQCSIHSPANRPSNGSGTTCFTAGLVYLNTSDVLRLELFNDSGKCVRWGPGKSFIGLFKLPQDLSTF